MSVKKITLAEFDIMPFNEKWNHIEALQTELTRLESMVQGREGMTLPDWYSNARSVATEGWNSKTALAMCDWVDSLTVPQGFIPDWSKAPSDADKVEAYWAGPNGVVSLMPMKVIPRPTPVKKMRTDEEIGRALWDFGIRFEGEANRKKVWADLPKSVKAALCTAAGISLEIEEGV